MLGELGKRNQRTDAQVSARLIDDLSKFGNVAQIDNAARPEQALLHQVEYIDAARLQDDRIAARLAAWREHCIRDRDGP